MKNNSNFVYQYTLVTKIIMSIIMLPVIALMMMLNLILFKSDLNQQGYLFFSLFGISLAVLVWLVRRIWHIYRFKLSLGSTYLNYRNLGRTYIVNVKDIIGYRISFGNLIINTHANHFKVFKNVADFSQLKQAIENRFYNLDKRDQEEHYNAFLADKRYGASPQEREECLTHAKKHVKWCMTILTILSVWVLIFPFPQMFLIIGLIICLLWAFILVHFSKGVISFHFEQHSIFPSLVVVIFFVPLMLLTRYITYADLFREQTYIVYTCILTLILSVWYLYLTKAHLRQQPKSILLLPFIILCLSGFSVRTIDVINVVADTSVKQQYQAEVLEKFSKQNSKDITRYYIRVKHWHKQEKPLELQLSLMDYQKITVGTPYNVVIRKGNLNISWIDTRVKFH